MIRLAGSGVFRRRGLGTDTLLTLCAIAGLAACRSDPPPGLVEQGDAAWTSGEFSRADELYARALDEDPASRAALLGRARTAVALNDPERALGLHGALAKVDRVYWQQEARDDYALALMEAARTRLAAGRSDAAVAALRALRRIDPEGVATREMFARALVARAAQLAMRGDREAALELYREAIAIDAHEVAAYVGAAEILIGNGRKQEAMTLLELARQTDPTDTRVRALTLEAMGLN
jgi:tetratricopeptide (TPR) repeat protein